MVLREIKPDVLVVQEMTSQAGMTQFLNEVLNTAGIGSYNAAPFNDGPDTDNGLFFREGRLEFLSAFYIPTALRDIAEYTVRRANSTDTLRIYSVHLKASQGTANEQQRLAEATTLRNHISTLPAPRFVTLGDFNIYTANEPAFQKLIGSEQNNNGRHKDPLNLTGNWQDNPAIAIHHTQSPRVRQFGGGAIGGMDDRFDMILISYSLENSILIPTYTAYGNDGNHLNDSINRLPNTAVPDSIAHALHNASDHLPVFADFVFGSLPTVVTLPPTDISTTSAVLAGTVNPNGSTTTAFFEWGTPPLYGTTTPPQTVGAGQGDVSIFDTLSGLSPGITFQYRVVAVSSADTLRGAGETFTTLPAAPQLLYPVNGQTGVPLPAYLQWEASTGAVRYHLQVSADSLFLTSFAMNDSLLSVTERLVDSLQEATAYFWRVRGGSSASWGPFAEHRWFEVSAAISVSVPVRNGWNLVSLPVSAANAATSEVFPTAASPAFEFTSNGYSPVDTLRTGAGYWLKFNAVQDVIVTGGRRATDSIHVNAGWNLVGSISAPVPAAAVVAVPSDIIASPFVGFDSGYVPSDTLLPGSGYWVKCNAPGVLILSEP